VKLSRRRLLPPRRRPSSPIPDLHGNTQGLKASQTKPLLALYKRQVPRGDFIHPELARRLAELSRSTSRQLGLLVDRAGRVDKVIVGDAHRIFIPDLGRSRAGSSRFRGLRLVVTQLRGEGITKDNLTDLALLQLDAVVVIQAGMDGLPGAVEMAHLLPPDGAEEEMWRIERHGSVHEWEEDFESFIRELELQFARAQKSTATDGRERAILLGMAAGSKAEALDSLAELKRLAHTAGLSTLDTLIQSRRRPDSRTFLGKGKLEEALLRSMHLGADVLVFDGELTPAQLRNIATSTEMKVLDRTQLILDIFAQRANTREGKLQVELAQLRYRRPRLSAMPTAMSRLTGGIGGRGPGETRLEINRRRADEREKRIDIQLEKIGRDRAMRRARRKRVGLPVVALVGYTNAGKSTLLNRMTRSDVDAEDKLFATLDPTSRRMRVPKEREVILTDTVGFIRALPKELIHAFRSTLDEVREADLILHVVDAASKTRHQQIQAVDAVLQEIGVDETPRMLVLNKQDRLPKEDQAEIRAEHGGLLCSAVSGAGLDAVLDAIQRSLFRGKIKQNGGRKGRKG
jgi:GTP-binding protein HflX